MAECPSSSQSLPESKSIIAKVQLDGSVVMKVVKHCIEEGYYNENVAQGALLGLKVNDVLEITNCFPFPNHAVDDYDEDKYQISMLRYLRRINADYFQVGWYQGSKVSHLFSLPLIETQYHYQTSIKESVVLIYDTQASAIGMVKLKAFRLTTNAMEMYKNGKFTSEMLLKYDVGFNNLFDEIPCDIRNSLLCNILMTELNELIPVEHRYKYLDLKTHSELESGMISLKNKVKELHDETSKFNRYQDSVKKENKAKEYMLQKRSKENAIRAAENKPPLPDHDINSQFSSHLAPPRLNSMIIANQINSDTQHISEFCGQSLGKLYLTQALQNAKESQRKQPWHRGNI